MNSLNILSVISTTPRRPSHTSPASGDSLLDERPSIPSNSVTNTGEAQLQQSPEETKVKEEEDGKVGHSKGQENRMYPDEQTPLLGGLQPEQFGDIKKSCGWRTLPSRISTAVYGALKVVVTWITAPGRYLVACFFDGDGRFSPFLPLITVARAVKPKRRKRSTQMMTGSEISEKDATASSRSEKDRGGHTSRGQKKQKRTAPVATASSASSVSSESEIDAEKLGKVNPDAPLRHSRSRSSLSATGEEIAPSRRSIRIKLHNEDALKRRRKTQEESRNGNAKEADAKEMVAASLKSPSGGNVKMTRFPKAPLPPRPLVPRRQPSYSKATSNGAPQKTLIIDLDETLIHSHSKGGRFASGHMVEVKMPHAVGVNGVTIGPQVPILYYVHKRPHCDDFLRKVSKWYKLVIFTASVQEYADPVIDWLEMERSYFDARYYRQHCTMRNGAYIKDLSQVEPDLSKVMILDNSPVSYIFHEDNAIPIEGWISDPTDNDLLHLVPLLEGLQYVTDVRALLALRLGQPQMEVA